MRPQPKPILAPGVYGAAIGLDLVLLDVGRDAYFCLADVAPGLTGDLSAGALTGLAGEVTDALLAAGLARQAPGLDRGPLAVRAPQGDLIGAAPASPTGTEVLGFGVAVAGLAQTYWRRPFHLVLERAAARKLRLRAPQAANLDIFIRRAGAFEQLMPWSPVHGACLMQAALLLDYLAQVGLAADWVFGVRTWPFSAHCWVQVGDLVLGDTVERVAPYAPILKV